MVRMPVATLRVWERRYGLTQSDVAPSGQRLYSADDVRRLTLIKQLTELGHAIGSLARLDMAQLQRVAATHALAGAGTEAIERWEAPGPTARPWRLAVIGAALGNRLQRPTLLHRLDRPVAVLGPFDSVAQAASASQGTNPDAVLLHAPQLHEGWLAAIEAAAPELVTVPKAVLYSFATDSVCDALATAGTALLREPQPDAVVGQWLNGLSSKALAMPQRAADRSMPVVDPIPPRRWDDAALADFAGRLPTVACECPRHVVDLLLQLAHFEAYSAECEQRNAGDAALHANLRQTAVASRMRFEAALEHVALHEGWLLPASPAAADGPGTDRRIGT